MKQISDRATLRDGVTMPWLGLGLWRVEGQKTIDDAIQVALDAGYTAFDTATAYDNEEQIGRALHKLGVNRSDLFITTKLWNPQHVQGYDACIEACKQSLAWLRLDVIDLYLIHWPVPSRGKTVEAWRALIQLQKEGLVRSIGVSNFHIHHLEMLERETGVIPSVNQVERHPWLNQRELIDYCRAKNILVEAYSPLMRGHIKDEPVLAEIGDRHKKSAAQVVLRWHLQGGVACIPKSVHANRIQENAALFDFDLSDDEMASIDALNRNRRLLPDPDKMDYCG
ncbi:MAG: aldo/keto reductase [Eubacteriales bacterium]|nr:aldo/keto reductase [Eubacteriales bacterium]MDD4744682.1 aldo/keto reductase [Eubacteriales bacterium]